jgi:hypothetical protein
MKTTSRSICALSPDRSTFDTQIYISSAALGIERLASGVRGHCGVKSMHSLLDVEFKDNLSQNRSAMERTPRRELGGCL